jgi:NTE family protein
LTKTALVLGAGAFTGGSFEAGVLAALQDHHGWDAREADLIVGTSIGALVGSTLRFGLAPRDLFAYQTNTSVSKAGLSFFAKLGDIEDTKARFRMPRPPLPAASVLLRAMRNPWRSRAALLAAALPTGRYPLTSMTETLRRLTGADWPEAPLWTVATRLPHCERVVFGSHAAPDADVAESVTASCAVPGYFTPVDIGEDRFVDGGIHAPTNADLLADEGFDTVIVISPMSSRAVRGVNPLRLYCRALLASEVRKLRRRGTEVVVFQPGLAEQRAMGFNAFDETRGPRVAQVSYDVASEFLTKRDAVVVPLAA